MKKIASISLALLLSLTCFADKPEGVDSAIAWLEVVDSGSYKTSWQQAAPFFQDQLSDKQWEQALNQVRAPLGKVYSRQLAEANALSSIPGVPEGEYVVITLATNFEQKNAATETVTVKKVGNQWRVVGYFIK